MTILTKRGKRFFGTLAILAVIGWGIASLPDLEEYLKGTGENDRLRREHYDDLIATQLKSEWECLSDSVEAREAFIFRLMKRAGDLALFQEGARWKKYYDAKIKTGTLSIAEHESVLNGRGSRGGFYELPWSVNGLSLSERVLASSCAVNPSPLCANPRISFSVEEIYPNNQKHYAIKAIYENDYASWMVTSSNWGQILDVEYRNLRDNWEIDKTITALETQAEEQKQRNDELMAQARTTVGKMSTVDIPSYAVDAAVTSEYLRLKCGHSEATPTSPIPPSHNSTSNTEKRRFSPDELEAKPSVIIKGLGGLYKVIGFNTGPLLYSPDLDKMVNPECPNEDMSGTIRNQVGFECTRSSNER